MSKKSLRPTFEYSLIPCIRSSLHINFTSLAIISLAKISVLGQARLTVYSHAGAIISPISNENYVSITYLTVKVPGSEKSIS